MDIITSIAISPIYPPITQILMSCKDTIPIIVASSVLIAAGLWLAWRKIGTRRTPPIGIRDPISPASHEATVTRSPILSQTKTAPPVMELEAAATRVTDSDLREFMWDITYRAREEGPDWGDATSLEFIEELVDRMDDLRTILKHHQGQTLNDIQEFHQILERVLAHCGVDLIHSDQWAPSIQRAIAKEPTPGIETPTILRFGTTGIRRFGQLLRKQEVVLAVPL